MTRVSANSNLTHSSRVEIEGNSDCLLLELLRCREGSTSAMYKRLSKGALKRTAQPAGPRPCWSSRSEGARGSGIFKGCQRPFRRGVFGTGYSLRGWRRDVGNRSPERRNARRPDPNPKTRPATPQPAPAQDPSPVSPAAGRMSRIRTCANFSPGATHRRNRGPCRKHRPLAGPRRGLRA